MLYRDLLAAELKKKQDEFVAFARAQESDLGRRVAELDAFCAAGARSRTEALGDLRNCGAFPSEEINPRFCVRFGQEWTNHEETRRWAMGVLSDRVTFAADGSQLFLEREISHPVGAVQIGWFENHHDAEGKYEKRAEFHIVSTRELLADDDTRPETRIGQERLKREVAKISEFLGRRSGWQERGERMPLAFFDGTLLLSIGRAEMERTTIEMFVDLVEKSEAMRVPLVGFVDRSYARDLIAMLDAFAGRDPSDSEGRRTLDDVSLLHAGTLGAWGERTPFCFSRRRGLELFWPETRGESSVGFVYIQTTSDNPPARLDVPAWIFEEGLLDEVVDVVRAECCIGLGYPYAIEAADQTAVIPQRDREVFLSMLQAFAKEHNLNLKISRKAASKGRRR